MTVHPQHSMMLVREVMRYQQQQHVSMFPSGNLVRRKSNITVSRDRIPSGYPAKVGDIRISQFIIPDADLSNSRVNTNIENGSPIEHQYQLLYSIYNHITQYLSTECFTGVGDGTRGRGIKIRGQNLQKRRRRWRAGNRDPEKSQKEIYHQHQQNQRIFNNGDENDSTNSGKDHGGRYRRHNIFSGEERLKYFFKDNATVIKTKNDTHSFRDDKKLISTDNLNVKNSNYYGINSKEKNHDEYVIDDDDDNEAKNDENQGNEQNYDDDEIDDY